MDIRLYLKKEIVKIRKMALDLMAVLVKKAEENKQAYMPGYTDVYKRQPTTMPA